MNNNQLSGSIPKELGNMSALGDLQLQDNNLTGSIPLSFNNLANLQILYLNNNKLNDTIPISFNPAILKNFKLDTNHFTFTSIEHIAKTYSSILLSYSPQSLIRLHYKANMLSVSAGGTLTNNTYNWYKNGELIETTNGDSVFTITETGSYSVAVTNSIATKLTLFSDTVDITVLPVTLISFAAQKQNNTTVLNWKTANEIDNNYFNVEHSTDSKSFSIIGNVNAMNNRSANNYSFTDKSPLKGINYYRLKQVDKDGKFSYSDIAAVDFSNFNDLFAVSPNPASNKIKIILAQSNNVTEIILVDAKERTVITEKVQANNTSTEINISKLATGFYNVILKQNGQQRTFKLIKN